MTVAFAILAGFGIAFWYVIEDLHHLLHTEAEVGVDGPSLLRLATFEHEPTDTVDADTSLETL